MKEERRIVFWEYSACQNGGRLYGYSHLFRSLVPSRLWYARHCYCWGKQMWWNLHYWLDRFENHRRDKLLGMPERLFSEMLSWEGKWGTVLWTRASHWWERGGEGLWASISLCFLAADTVWPTYFPIPLLPHLPCRDGLPNYDREWTSLSVLFAFVKYFVLEWKL